MSGEITKLVEMLVAAGAKPKVILAAVREAEQQKDALAEDGREKARARWRKWKASNPDANAGKRLQTLANVDKRLVRERARVDDISSNLEITGQEENKRKRAPAARRVAADDFKAELTDILDDERIEALCAVRRKKGATFTAHAGRLLSKALSACPDPRAAADEMVLRNWTGIKPEWLDSKTPRSQAPPRRDTYVDAMNRILEGRANGTENLFGTDGDAQRLPADGKRQGIDVADVRGGLARRFIQGSH